MRARTSNSWDDANSGRTQAWCRFVRSVTHSLLARSRPPSGTAAGSPRNWTAATKRPCSDATFRTFRPEQTPGTRSVQGTGFDLEFLHPEFEKRLKVLADVIVRIV